MESPKSILVIYRLKFKSQQAFDNAVEVFRFGEKLMAHMGSLQQSFRLKPFEPIYPTIDSPEINMCKDDFVIYVCSHEGSQYLKGYAGIDVMSKRFRENIPRLPYYYELFLKSTFGSIADLSIAASDPF